MLHVTKAKYLALESDLHDEQRGSEHTHALLNDLAAESWVVLRALLDLLKTSRELACDHDHAPGSLDLGLLTRIGGLDAESALKPDADRVLIQDEDQYRGHGDWLKTMCRDFDPHGHVADAIGLAGPTRQILIRALLYWHAIGMAGGFSRAPRALCDRLAQNVLHPIANEVLDDVRAHRPDERRLILRKR